MIVWVPNVIAQNKDPGSTATATGSLDLQAFDQIPLNPKALGTALLQDSMECPTRIIQSPAIGEVAPFNGETFGLRRIDTGIEVAHCYAIDGQMGNTHLFGIKSVEDNAL